MRRTLRWFTSVGLLGIVVGCEHMHGVCDCNAPPCPPHIASLNYNPTCSSCATCGGAPAVPVVAVPAAERGNAPAHETGSPQGDAQGGREAVSDSSASPSPRGERGWG